MTGSNVNEKVDEYFLAFSSPDLDARHVAVDAMANLAREALDAGDASVAKAVLSKLNDSDMNVRWYLGRALVRIGTPLIPIIVEAAESEADAGVQKYYGAIMAAFKDVSVTPLIKLFESENPVARGMAGAALEKIGEPALDPLLEAAKSENHTVKICAGIVLMKLGVYNY